MMMIDFSAINEVEVLLSGTCLFKTIVVKAASHVITFNGHNLTIDNVWQAANRQFPCMLADDARPGIRQCRQFVETVAKQPRAIYGINTGFGPLSGFRVSPEE